MGASEPTPRGVFKRSGSPPYRDRAPTSKWVRQRRDNRLAKIVFQSFHESVDGSCRELIVLDLPRGSRKVAAEPPRGVLVRGFRSIVRVGLQNTLCNTDQVSAATTPGQQKTVFYRGVFCKNIGAHGKPNGAHFLLPKAKKRDFLGKKRLLTEEIGVANTNRHLPRRQWLAGAIGGHGLGFYPERPADRPV